MIMIPNSTLNSGVNLYNITMIMIQHVYINTIVYHMPRTPADRKARRRYGIRGQDRRKVLIII